MKNLLLVFPHQLFHPDDRPHLFKEIDEIHLVEDSLFFCDPHVAIPFHKNKIVFHRASMQAYFDLLKKSFPGKTIAYHEYSGQTIETLLEKLSINCKMSVINPTDYLLERRIRRVLPDIQFIESPLFLNKKADNEAFCKGKKKYLMHHFYTFQRRRLNILMNDDDTPIGNQWSFDDDNRKKIPKKLHDQIPAEPMVSKNEYTLAAKQWVESAFSENPGSHSQFWYPVTHKEARDWFDAFLKERFSLFGDYEDAMVSGKHTLYHSILSPLLNAGLLDVCYVIEKALSHAKEHEIPLNSLEGFIRQIIGWREYVRMMYEKEGISMRNQNYWNHTEKLPLSFWDGTTGIGPLDEMIIKINRTGYLHHIERLMIMGNMLFLLEVHPDHVYEWFMSLSIDSYDWVMVPNIYGMSQHAAGNLMTTKPYMSGSNYVKKMSDFKKGDWCEIWDALYWNFMIKHADTLSRNHRMGMIISRVRTFSDEKKKAYKSRVELFREHLWLDKGKPEIQFKG